MAVNNRYITNMHLPVKYDAQSEGTEADGASCYFFLFIFFKAALYDSSHLVSCRDIQQQTDVQLCELQASKRWLKVLLQPIFHT